MPISPAWAASQNYGDITKAVLTDTSTGSGSTITGRLVYLQKFNGTYLVPYGTTTSYIYWPYSAGAGDTISIDALDKDYALYISVVFYSGSSIFQTVSALTLFKAYTMLFLRQLTQAQEARQSLLTNNNFWYNKFKLRGFLEDAEDAVSSLNDQQVATYALNECKKMTDDISTFF